jgi:hypothetical protein
VTIAMIENPSYDLITRTCKRYDKAMDKTKKAEEEEINLLNQAGFGKDKVKTDVICSYKSCGKKGHTQEQCWMKKKDRRVAQHKRTDPEAASAKTVRTRMMTTTVPSDGVRTVSAVVEPTTSLTSARIE